ncbi:hypothetical protein HPP92_010821 [Vanilla planifolia]|uniref:Uncharacterized protein n=1 Tax=Vanilla planifolia TaxID=51239 RepID=A0A835V053_VANPL|nr:hypothetical protein HPP92_010821 [Vanilla planifolia]
MAKAESNSNAQVRIHSRRMVKPFGVNGEIRRPRQLHLNHWDLHYLSGDYIKKCLLFPHNPAMDSSKTIDLLFSSFCRTLDIFYPLAGRFFTTVHHHHTTPFLSIHLDCNDAGAEFIHAATSDLTAEDITSSSTASGAILIPPVVRYLFPLSRAVNHDAYFLPVLAVQVTVLADGSLFLAKSFNHMIGNGFSFWFFNTWSAFCRSAGTAAVVPPTVEKFFLPSTPPPILLNSDKTSEFIYHEVFPTMREGFFCFSRRTVATKSLRFSRTRGVKLQYKCSEWACALGRPQGGMEDMQNWSLVNPRTFNGTTVKRTLC